MKKVVKNVPCEHWPNCDGCPLVNRPYPEQLKIKFEKVLSAFIGAGFGEKQITQLMRPTRSSPQTLGYRNKAKWILEPDDTVGVRMGMYKPGTHEVIHMPQCAVHAPEINRVSEFIRQHLIAQKVPVGAHEGNEPRVRYLIVRYSFREKKLITVFVTSAEKVPGLDKVFAALAADAEWAKKCVAIVQNINADSGNVLLGEANRYFKKSGELTETMGPFRVPVGPLSFLQVNSLQASYLYKRVRELLGRGPFNAGLDLYSGVGLIAMHMAASTKKILAVEEVGPAALEAMTAARRNRVSNILELCADSLEGVATFSSEWGAPDWVVLNPPRGGCEESVLEAVALKAPKRLVYVSCGPKSLARDIKVLQQRHSGFKIRAIEPVDMFPQTEHTECLVLLENESFESGAVSKAKGSKIRMKGARPKTRPLH